MVLWRGWDWVGERTASVFLGDVYAPKDLQRACNAWPPVAGIVGEKILAISF